MDLGRYRKLLSSSVQLENKVRQSRSRENEGTSASRLARERNSAVVSPTHMVSPVQMQRRTELSNKHENRALWESLHNFDVAFDGTKTVGRLDGININKNRVGSQTGSHRIKVLNYTEDDNIHRRKIVQKAQSSVD